MTTQIITVFCEGPHDIAFLNRIFKTIGFKSNDGCKIGDYPAPFNDFIKQEATKTNIKEINIAQLRRSLLPVYTLKRADVHVFFYSMEGDGKKPIRQKMLNKLEGFIPKQGEIRTLPEGTQLSVLYLFDADDFGVQYRINEVQKELKEIFPDEDFEFTDNATFHSIADIKIGLFIFSNSEDKGDLEDILVPLMKKGNEKIFEDAKRFLDDNFDDTRLFKLRLSTGSGKITEKRSIKKGDKYKYDFKKSLIGTVGQLQKSGRANTVCISDCDYLTLSKMQSDPKYKEIVEFIEGFVA